VPHAELTQMQELPPEMQPHLAKPPRIDEGEAFLTSLFLPRYVTYYGRRRPYAQMQGAARLLRSVAATAAASA